MCWCCVLGAGVFTGGGTELFVILLVVVGVGNGPRVAEFAFVVVVVEDATEDDESVDTAAALEDRFFGRSLG